MQIENKNCPLGDTIGGLTAPFINIGAALLLYYTLMEQIKANKSQNIELLRQKNEYDSRRLYESFIHYIDNISKDIYEFTSNDHSNYKGLYAVNRFARLFGSDVDDAYIKKYAVVGDTITQVSGARSQSGLNLSTRYIFVELF